METEGLTMPYLIWLVVGPVWIGTLALLLPTRLSRLLVTLFRGVLFALSVWVFLGIRQTGMVEQTLGNWPVFAAITLRADFLAIDLILLTALVYALAGLYEWNRAEKDRLFLFLFTSMQGLINGIFLSGDLFNLFVLLEVATLVNSVLIMFKKDSQAMYDGLIYLLVNTVSMSFFLMGTGILYKTTGLLDLKLLAGQIPVHPDPSSLLLPYAFLMVAASLKSALMPLFSWLPKAHGTPSAPSAVSAVLSGIYVKSGVYLYERLQTVFSPVIDTRELFLVLGFITAVVGFVLALLQKDIKLILAYHTVSQIGLIMIGLNQGSEPASFGAFYHIINHALFKSTLFLAAGLIIRRYQTQNIYDIRGLMRSMPLTGIATALAILGITGAPFFNGSISKYWIGYGSTGSWLEYGLLLINFGTILSFTKFSTILFGPRAKSLTQEGARASDLLAEGVVLFMGVLCLLGGVFSESLTTVLFGLPMTIGAASFPAKSLTYLLLALAAAALYGGLLKKRAWLKSSGRFELTFNGIVASQVGFFAFLLLYVIWQAR